MTIIRIKTILAMIVSFFISLFIINYSQFPGSPNINTSLVARDIQETTFNVTEKINPLKIISSITIPNFFSQNITQTPVIPSPTNNAQPTPIISYINKKISPTTPARYPTIKKRVTPTIKPTNKPTSKPTSKPTAIPPKPTEIPIGIIRPGKNYDEMVEFVAKKTCIPAALLKAFGAIESGDKTQSRIARFPLDRFVKYNTYDWWNNPSTSQAQVCEGIAYNHHTGLIPANSQYAGTRCMGAETFSTDIFSMGYLSISQSEEDDYRQRVLDLLKVDKIDRRVFFDSTVIAALHYKNISTYRDKDCNDWESKYIAKAACKYLGACKYDWGARNGDYCQEICDLYNNFTSGQKVNCKNISSIFVNYGSGGCVFK